MVWGAAGDLRFRTSFPRVGEQAKRFPYDWIPLADIGNERGRLPVA